MFIKEVIIDGFKSYGTRTEVRGFDQQFNAITGLNGSGKSNILDAICFVLGITNLKQVSVALTYPSLIDNRVESFRFVSAISRDLCTRRAKLVSLKPV